MPHGDILQGTVERIEDHYAYVACPDAPRHLQTLILRVGWDSPSDVKVGDKLVCTYLTSRTGALWKGQKA